MGLCPYWLVWCIDLLRYGLWLGFVGCLRLWTLIGWGRWVTGVVCCVCCLFSVRWLCILMSDCVEVTVWGFGVVTCCVFWWF